MKKMFSVWGRWGLILAFIVMLLFVTSSASNAVSVTFKTSGTIKNSGGSTPLAQNRVVQLIRAAGGVIHPPNASGNPSGGDVLIDDILIGEGTGTDGTFVYYVETGIPDGSYVYVRAWDDTTVGSGKQYGASTVKLVGPGDNPPPEDFIVAPFSTTYIADAPPVPTNVQASNVGYDGATITWNLNANYELTGEVMSYGTDTNATNLGIISVSGTSYTFPRLALFPGTTYFVKVRALNYFGSSGWSDPLASWFTTLGTNFGGNAIGLRIQLSGQLPSSSVTLIWLGSAQTYEVWSSDLNGAFAKIDQTSSKSWSNLAYATISATTERSFQIRVPNGQGAPEVVGWQTFNLKKKTGGTGINSISIPFNTGVAGNSPNLYTASDVADSIGSRFDFIGGWNKANQTEFAYLSGGLGTNFPINKGEGYQVSVSSEANWTIVGQK